MAKPLKIVYNKSSIYAVKTNATTKIIKNWYFVCVSRQIWTLLNKKNEGMNNFMFILPSFLQNSLLLLRLDFVAYFLEGCDEVFVFRF